MASKRSLEDRVSRLETARPARTAAEEAEHRALKAMPLADLKRLEGLMTRVESGDPSAALTTEEREWYDKTMKRLGFSDAP